METKKMHKEVHEEKKNNLLFPIGIIVFVIFIFSVLVHFLNITKFLWLYELCLVIVLGIGINFIFKNNFSKYIYCVIDNIFMISIALGRNEKSAFEVYLRNIKAVLTADEIEAVENEQDIQISQRLYPSSTNGKISGILYYDIEKKCDKMITFAPTDELIEILNKKMLDN